MKSLVFRTGPTTLAMTGLKLALVCAVYATFCAVGASEPVRIYLANDEHTDFLWTADAETYHAVFVDMLDYYLRLAEVTRDHPAPYRSRFNADGSYWLWQYERRKSTADFDLLMARVKDGSISAPLTTLVSCYGGQPAEAVLRGMYYAGRLERRYDLRFPMAVAMENQTLPLGLPSLWAGAGAKYSWRGVCACASKIPQAVLEQRDHEIYWYTGRDGRRVLMKWHSLANGNNRSIGGYAEAFDPVAAVRDLDSNPTFLSRYTDPSMTGPYLVRGAFGFGWDALDRKTGQPHLANERDYPFAAHFHDVAREQSTAERQVIASNEQDFFADFETHYGANLPSETVTYGNEWDLYSASMAETSASVRRSVEKLRASELAAALVSLKTPGFLRGRETARDRAFADLGLYWEHDWTADGPVPRSERAAWQNLLASEIAEYVNSLQADAVTQLGALIQQPNVKAPRFYALNPLGWSRTDHADFAYNGPRNIHVRDLSTDLDVPHQFVELKGRPYLRVLASDVPSAGYKAFEILEGPGLAPTNAAAIVGAGQATLENSCLKVAVDADGAIASLVDKARPEVEFAATINGLKLNDFAANETNGDALVIEETGPVSVTLRCRSNAGRHHTTRITLVRDCDSVKICNEITENFGEVRHWAFSFNLVSPDVHTEEIGAVIRVKKKSDGGDYANTHARYDYASLNHFADITDGANLRGVTLANADCAFVRLGSSRPDHLDTATPQFHVLAGGQVDGASLGIPGQDGATYFLQRFALRPHARYNPAAAMKFSLEFQNPLITGTIAGTTNSPYPSTNYSLLSISNPQVLLWALKPHEDGVEHGLVARVWNQSSESSRLQLRTAAPIDSARLLTHLESSLGALQVTNGALDVIIAGERIESYGLKLRD